LLFSFLFHPSFCPFSISPNSTEVSLITRGTRSLGYGFVTFSTEAEAKKAVEALNKKEVGGREINVEGARPQNALPANGLKKKSNNKKKAAGVSNHTLEGR